MISLVVALTALAALAQETSNSLSFNDQLRDQTITVTAVDNDAVRVDVVPNSWHGQRLPSLVQDRALKNSNPVVKVNDLEDMSVLTTENGLRVVCDKSTGSITVICGNTFYITDLCNRKDGTVTLLHQGGESFYGAGERGYSFNLAGDTLINYNAQNYGYQMGEMRTKQPEEFPLPPKEIILRDTTVDRLFEAMLKALSRAEEPDKREKVHSVKKDEFTVRRQTKKKEVRANEL